MDQDILGYVNQIKQTNDYFAKAKLITFLVRKKKIKVKDLSVSLGLKPSYLCHIMRLNKLSEIIMDGYYSQLITLSHLFVLSLLTTESDIMDVYEAVLGNSLTVLQTEELVRSKRHGISPAGEYIQEVKIKHIKSKLKESFNAEMKVIQTRIKTKVIIEWKGSKVDRMKDVEGFFQAIEGRVEKD
jgi:hypothetical protein